MNILTIGFSTEGPTDERFLRSIILRVFESLAYNAPGEIEVFEPVFIPFPRAGSFLDSFGELSRAAKDKGINILCVHLDADDSSDSNVWKFKIAPALKLLETKDPYTVCSNIVPVVPIYMTEAWMLADNHLLKEEMFTTLSDNDLGLTRDPESVSNPKELLNKALQIAQAHLPKRRARMQIEDLYQPISQQISLQSLENLSSFRKFKGFATDALKRLNYLH